MKTTSSTRFQPTARPWRRAALLAAAGLLIVAFGASAQNTRQFSESLSPGGLLELDLKTGASVEIRAVGGSTVEVRAEVGASSDPVDIRVSPTQRGVRVSAEMAERQRNHRSHVKLFVDVPTVVDIEVDSMGGSVSIDGVDGEISGRTMGGALKLRNLRGELDLSTMGGDIELVDSEVDGQVSTMGGEVLIRDVVGDVDGSSMGGNVRLINVTRSSGRSTGDAVIVTTMGGKIEVDEAPAGAELETMGGNVVVKRAQEYVDASTMGGDIRIEEIAGWVEATTMGGDIQVHVVSGPFDDHHVELTSMSGEIELSLPADLGFTFDIELEYTKNREGQYRIDSDFQLDQQEEREWRSNGRRDTPRKAITAKGRVGDGAHRVKIRTINGNVTIRRR